MIGYQLGQQVVYQKSIERRHSRTGEFDGPNKLWSSELYPGRQTGSGAGIIVGKRTLSNGYSDYSGYEGQIVYAGKDYFQAYLVAYDLRRKPVYVLPEHLTPLEISVGTKVRYWPGVRDGYEGTLSATRTAVWEMADGTAMVCVDGYPGGIQLSHIQIQED